MVFRRFENGFSSVQKWFFVGLEMVFRRFKNGFSSVQKWFFVGSKMVFRRFFADLIIRSKIRLDIIKKANL